MTYEESESAIRTALGEHDHERAAVLTLRAYADELLGYLIVQLRDPEQAREVFACFAEDLWQALPSLVLRSSMRAYCYALARHASHRYLDRDVRKQRRGVPLSAALSQLAFVPATRTAEFARTDARTRVALLRERLSPEERELLTLRVDRRLSWSEIAEALGAAEGDLARAGARYRKRFQLLKDRLADWAREEGIVPSDDA